MFHGRGDLGKPVSLDRERRRGWCVACDQGLPPAQGPRPGLSGQQGPRPHPVNRVVGLEAGVAKEHSVTEGKGVSGPGGAPWRT